MRVKKYFRSLCDGCEALAQLSEYRFPKTTGFSCPRHGTDYRIRCFTCQKQHQDNCRVGYSSQILSPKPSAGSTPAMVSPFGEKDSAERLRNI